MAVRPMLLPITEQTSSPRYGIARSSQTEYTCVICGKPVDVNTSEDDVASKAMHEGCYVLRQMLKRSTTPTNARA